ncbi:MAG: SDR family oxidoreductase [Nitrospirae bacterium]|nr:MAG: SDR family oxidoreductase [Nitrospirota bacterium]
MHVLVTGGAGFIGSNLTEALLDRGDSVCVLDDFSTGKRENLAFVEAKGYGDRFRLVEGDMRDPEIVAEAMQGVEVCFHQAALGSVPKSVADPRTTHDVNLNGHMNVLLAARDAGVRRLVCAGSSSSYGDTPTLPKVETMPPLPLSPYAVTKYTQEVYCQVFTRVYGLETVVLRYFNIYGRRQDPFSQYAAVIPIFVKALLEGRPPTIHGDGHQTRDFTYIDDCVQANLKAAEAEGVAGEVFNVATGKRVELLELYHLLCDLLDRHLEPVHGPPRPGDIKHSLADIDKARRLLGYEPAYDIHSGLREAIAWYREHL